MSKGLKFWLLLMVALVAILHGAACAIHNKDGVVVVSARQEYEVCRSSCILAFPNDKDKQSICTYSCKTAYTVATGEQPPDETTTPMTPVTPVRPAPPTPVPGDTAVPPRATEAPLTPAPSPTAIQIASPAQCTEKVTSYSFTSDEDYSHSKYAGKVKAAMAAYQTKHPEQFDGSMFLFDPKDPKGGPSQDVFFAGLIYELATKGYDACVDNGATGAGDVIVSERGTKPGEGIAELMHPLSSERLVQGQPFKGVFKPRWF